MITERSLTILSADQAYSDEGVNSDDPVEDKEDDDETREEKAELVKVRSLAD